MRDLSRERILSSTDGELLKQFPVSATGSNGVVGLVSSCGTMTAGAAASSCNEMASIQRNVRVKDAIEVVVFADTPSLPMKGTNRILQ